MYLSTTISIFNLNLKYENNAQMLSYNAQLTRPERGYYVECTNIPTVKPKLWDTHSFMTY